LKVLTIRRATAIEQPPPPGRFLVRVVGNTAGTELTGWGEPTAPGRSIDDDPEAAWQLLVSALDTLPGTEIPLREVPESLDEVRRVMVKLGEPAGVEPAILALVAQSYRLSPSELLDAGRGPLRRLRRLAPRRPAAPATTTDQVSIAAILPDSGRYHHAPGSGGPVLYGRRANRYVDERPTRVFGKNGMRSHVVERAALAHGLSTTRYSATMFAADDGAGRSLVFGNSARSPVSGASSFMIADQHKGAAHALLARAGVPVPEGRVFAPGDLAGATRYARSIGYPVVTKPVSGTGGTGVSTHITDDAGLAAGFQAIQERPRHAREDILVERHVAGEVYRIIVHGDVVTATAMREPASVTGDGIRSIAELVVEKNAYRRENPRLRKALIGGDGAAAYLRTAGLDLAHVPARDERVFLSDRPYLRDGGDWIEVLEELHPSIAEAAVRAVATVPGLRFCGVDILLEDHRRPIDQQSAGICELNACPELVSPQYPLFGEPRPIVRRLLEMAAAAQGVALPAAPAAELAVRISVEGREIGSYYQRWFLARARALGLTGWIERTTDDRLDAVVRGGLVPVSTLASTAITGPSRSRPRVVTTRHAEVPETDGFALAEPAVGAR
jgi:D-alanine-D-alanine ligase-like ATP-grasp enzyme/acylphosphatase